MIRSKAMLVVGPALAAAALLAQATETSLARLRVDSKGVGWDGVDLGMSLVQTERRVGTTLALSDTGKGNCGRFTVDVERGTLRLTVGFPSARPGAKIESIYVHFEGYQVLAKREDLVAELERLAPQSSYVAPATQPEMKEAEAADPIYRFRSDSDASVRLDIGRGALIAPLRCID